MRITRPSLRVPVGIVAAGIAVALAVTGCGSSPTSGATKGSGGEQSAAVKLYAEIGGLSGKERRDKLVELAEKEGTLDLYTSMTSDVADSVSSAFGDAFD